MKPSVPVKKKVTYIFTDVLGLVSPKGSTTMVGAKGPKKAKKNLI